MRLLCFAMAAGGPGEALAMGQGGNNEHASCTTPGRVVTHHLHP
jgi:hypothetical protein